MEIKNETQLKRVLMPKLENALFKTQEKVYQIIDRYLKMFYADYDPVLYDRTEQLLRSLVKSQVHQDGNGFVAEVYFNFNELKYYTGAKPEGIQVMDAAAKGGHGAEGLRVVAGNIGIWEDPIRVLDEKAIKILKRMLISEGIPIK